MHGRILRGIKICVHVKDVAFISTRRLTGCQAVYYFGGISTAAYV